MQPRSDLLHRSGTSLYRQLFIVLRDEILNKVRAPGSALPTEEALCAQFSVSRATVRRALADLSAHGYIARRQGLGSYVTDQLHQPQLSPAVRMVDDLRQIASETDVEVLEILRGEAPERIARVLQLSDAELALHALRLRSQSGTPVMLTDAWIPARLGRNITVAKLKRHALYELLLIQGVVFGRVVQEISAEAANPQRARLLDTEVGAPVLKVVRLLHDELDRPVQFISVYMLPERSRVVMSLPGDAMNTLSAGQFVHDVTTAFGRPLITSTLSTGARTRRSAR